MLIVAPDQHRNLGKQRLSICLQPEELELIREAIELGLAVSTNEFIEEAVRLRSREVRHARLRKLAQEAMDDPDFAADMRETMADFSRSGAVIQIPSP